MQHDQIARFWDKYIIKLIHYNVPERSRRWYVKHAEDYIKAHSDLPLKQHTELNLTNYLNTLNHGNLSKPSMLFGFSLSI